MSDEKGIDPYGPGDYDRMKARAKRAEALVETMTGTLDRLGERAERAEAERESLRGAASRRADDVMRLEAEVERLRTEPYETERELAAEVERLRAALRESDAVLRDQSQLLGRRVVDAHDILRRALATTEEEPQENGDFYWQFKDTQTEEEPPR